MDVKNEGPVEVKAHTKEQNGEISSFNRETKLNEESKRFLVQAENSFQETTVVQNSERNLQKCDISPGEEMEGKTELGLSRIEGKEGQISIYEDSERKAERDSCSRIGEEFDDEEEELDPRIQSELERLNKAASEINRLELCLEDARSKFRSTLNESTQKLDVLSKKLGHCVEKARPYYQARLNARTIQSDTQNSALRYERACSMHAAAKEMVNVAEQGFLNKGQQFDTAWQEMLNHATTKVNEAETEIMESELEHAKMTLMYHESEQTVKRLHREHKRSIHKSRSYFELKGEYNRRMEEWKKKVDKISQDLRVQKSIYSYALKALEKISDDIHAEREKRRARNALGKRVSGVGAEAPEPSPHDLSRPETTGATDADTLHERVTEIKNLPAAVIVKEEDDIDAHYSRTTRSPSRDSASLILSVNSLTQALPSLPYTKVSPKKSVSTKKASKDANAAKHGSRENARSSGDTMITSRDNAYVTESTIAKDTTNVAVDTVAKDTADVAMDTVVKDDVSVDNEDLLDTDSESSSVHLPDDDLVADVLNDFTDEDFVEPVERFQTLPANLNYADLKTYFKQGELKKWGDKDDLH